MPKKRYWMTKRILPTKKRLRQGDKKRGLIEEKLSLKQIQKKLLMMIKLRLQRILKKTRLQRVKAASEEEEAGKEKEMDDVEEEYSFDQANKESDDVINNDLKCERG